MFPPAESPAKTMCSGLTGGVWVEAKTLKETELDVGSLIDVGDEEVWELMRKEKERRITVFEEKFGVKADRLGDAHKQ